MTETFVDTVEPPASGERWIADTQLRGFGLRLWVTNGRPSLAYAIRSSDRDGRPVRRTYRPFQDSGWEIRWRLRSGEIEVDELGGVRFSVFLGDARSWAETELKRLKGRVPTLQQEEEVRQEHETMREAMGTYLRRRSLGELVELVLSRGYSRGWTETYTDRLRNAFDTFDPSGVIRAKRIGNLEDGELVELIEDSTLGTGNLRLLRSLFKVVFWNVHDLGGPAIGRVLPSLRGIETQLDQEHEFLWSLEPTDFQVLLDALRATDMNWRAAVCIELCFNFWAPVVRIMEARWDQIVDGRWYPYHPTERKNWSWQWSNIDQPEFDCLLRARQSTLSEGIVSPYLFPSPKDPSRPIATIDRAWASLLGRLGWPTISLAKAAPRFRRMVPIGMWPDLKRREKHAAIVAEWQADMAGTALNVAEMSMAPKSHGPTH